MEEAAAGVAGECGDGGAFSDEVAHCGRAVGDGDGKNFHVEEVEGTLGSYGVQPVLGAFGRWAKCEVWVEEAVHEAGGHGVEGVGQSVDVDSCAVVHGLQTEAGQVSDVVEVAVGKENGLEGIFFLVSEAGH